MSVHLDISPREVFRETVLTTTQTDVKGDELTRERKSEMEAKQWTSKPIK